MDGKVKRKTSETSDRPARKMRREASETLLDYFDGTWTLQDLGVQYKNQKVNLNLYIVKENLDTILGREWLYKTHLDWPAIKAIRAKTEQSLNNLLREYKDIFDDKLGEISNFEAKLKLRPGVKPIFCRVRTVPFALKGRVENEIDRLEREGIIEKGESSEWATPVVPVVKTDGSIRLCADYSVT
ncbi:retrovirus-related Pol polyprotein from transposon 412 [Trichonephila clavata]|uniref:Retrovirus-related Pol polyprotein from transposon 412 n=1 Tax=Trichonephila clavata TaxID=2740835 RepID=A0A8X6F9Y7_TRICU|nr:retrovirus-related Pol polyprotein from transposon 412 [Trichonephila clavata]